MNLLDYMSEQKKETESPLASRLRPTTLDEVVGQKHIIGKDKLLYRAIQADKLSSLIFYGPPGTGKTTLAKVIANTTSAAFLQINATSAGKKDMEEVVEKAKENWGAYGRKTILFIDEIHRFNKSQQDYLLPFVEDGTIVLIGATTENPYFYIYNAILSRSTVFEFKVVEPAEIERAVQRAFIYLEEERGERIVPEEGVIPYIAQACGGDVRKSINAVELCVLASPMPAPGEARVITLAHAKELSQRSALRYDRAGDEHYDILSAFQKSMRGSDPDAALHYLARLLEAGDLPSATRRLMVCACEDVGLAYPMIIPIVKAAVDAALQVGLPEARIPLADAVVLVATAPKSNSAYDGINRAMDDVQRGKSGPIPRTLQNVHYDGADNPNKGQFYEYPHEYPNHWLPQQYLPDALNGTRYYEYGENKTEQAAKAYWEKIKSRKG